MDRGEQRDTELLPAPCRWGRPQGKIPKSQGTWLTWMRWPLCPSGLHTGKLGSEGTSTAVSLGNQAFVSLSPGQRVFGRRRTTLMQAIGGDWSLFLPFPWPEMSRWSHHQVPIGSSLTQISNNNKSSPLHRYAK